MSLIFKMQKTLVNFSLKVRVLFIFSWRCIDSKLFELIHLDKNMKKPKDQRIGFLKFSFSIQEKIMIV